MENRSLAGLLSIALMMLPASVRAAPESDLWAFWEPLEITESGPIDHSTWQLLLDRYLISADGQIARFAYRSVSEQDRKRLNDYLAAMADIDPRHFERSEQMAYWINLYNALTVKVVLQHPGKRSITRMGRGLFSFGPWNDEVITVVGENLTLNDIEHRILRPIWRDHRIHFAVNCASLGCPDLLETAFTGAKLETLLASAEQRYLNHPRGVQFDGSGELVVSSIFDWYLEDFATDDATLLAYLAANHNRLSTQLAGYAGRIRYAYDWSLNELAEESGSVSTHFDSDTVEWDDADDDEWYEEP